MSAILVTGANGQVGFELQRSLRVLGNVVELTRADMDLASKASILAALDEHKLGIIVNPAYTAVDRAESDKESAMAVNATAPGIMAHWAADHGAVLIHYPTDYAFDGTKADPHREEDAVNPQSVYGESRLGGRGGGARLRCPACTRRRAIAVSVGTIRKSPSTER